MKKATSERKIPAAAIIGGILLVAVVAVVLMATQLQPKEAPYTPASPQPQPPVTTGGQTMKPAEEPPCNHDGICDANETKQWCPGDCIPPEVISAERSAETPYQNETSPTVTISVQAGNGVQSCGVSPNDAAQWDCVVKSPGAITTDVDCTLRNYVWDGKYMIILRCKDTQGNDIPAKMIDDIIICADPLGCKR